MTASFLSHKKDGIETKSKKRRRKKDEKQNGKGNNTRLLIQVGELKKREWGNLPIKSLIHGAMTT